MDSIFRSIRSILRPSAMVDRPGSGTGKLPIHAFLLGLSRAIGGELDEDRHRHGSTEMILGFASRYACLGPKGT